MAFCERQAFLASVPRKGAGGAEFPMWPCQTLGWCFWRSPLVLRQGRLGLKFEEGVRYVYHVGSKGKRAALQRGDESVDLPAESVVVTSWRVQGR